MSSLEEMSKALHAYYQSVGKGNEYVDEQGVEKLTKWCDTNGMTLKDIDEDLKEPATECLIVDFDETFPLPPQFENADDAQKREEIHKILLQCRRGKAQKIALREIDQASFDAIGDQDVEQIKQIFAKYCPIIYNRGMKIDANLLFLLAYQRKHGIDVLCNLVDSFDRYRILYDPAITSSVWVSLQQNTHFQKLGALKVKVPTESGTNSTTYGDVAKSCMHSFSHRCCSKLMFENVQVLIDDSIQHVVNYIAAAISFISNSVRAGAGKQQTVPFGLDVAIAVGQPRQSEKDQKEAEDDEDDDDDDDDEEPQGGEDSPAGPYKDWVQEIEDKLKGNKLAYLKTVAKQTDENRRMFENIFKDFILKNDLSGADKERQHYLANKRLVAFVDRRRSKKKDANVDDEIFMYEPPNDEYTQKVPQRDELVNEWFFSASRTCLLPNVEYNAKVVVGNDPGQVTKSKTGPGGNIGASDHCNGGVITFSFHVFSEDKMKLYLYFQGQMIRFLPRDIKLLLPRLFVPNEDNEKYIADKTGDLDKVIKELEGKLLDTQFAAWLKAYPCEK